MLRLTWRNWVYLGLAAFALGQSGCLLVAAGAATAGALTYAYVDGELTRDFPADLPEVQQATRTALAELQLPIEVEANNKSGITLTTRTADKDKVTIRLATVASPIPAEGDLTRVRVRVGVFGDEQVSERLLTQISAHLAYPGQPGPKQGPPVIPLPTPIRPVGFSQPDSVAPPLANQVSTSAPPLAGSSPEPPRAESAASPYGGSAWRPVGK